MALVLRGANTTAQWYWDDFPGGTLFPHLEKSLKHTTETKGWPGYSGGASAPNATYHPLIREIRQHFPCNVSSRALRDPSSTVVRENRDRVFQLEIVCYSDKALARSVGGLWVGDLTDAHFTDLAWIDIQLNQDLGLPLQTSVQWREGQGTFVSGVRLSGPQFDAYRGILGHVHASGNTHWDPGGFRASRLMAKIAQLKGIPPQEDDVNADQDAKLTNIDRNVVAITSRVLAMLDMRPSAVYTDPVTNAQRTEVNKIGAAIDKLPAAVSAAVIAALPGGSVDAALVEAACERAVKNVLLEGVAPTP